jgi:hypothetical protein
MNKIIPVIFLAFFFLTACDKEDNTPSDLRDEFRGQYQCRETVSCYGSCGTCSTVRDTIISIDYGNSDSTITVLGREVWLDSAGSYSAYHYGLYFRNDSIFSNYMNGGLGCGQYESYVGVKISDTP